RPPPNIQYETDYVGEAHQKHLPEANLDQLGRMTPQHSVIFGDEVRATAAAKHATNLAENSPRVGNRLQQMPADNEVELLVRKRQGQRVAGLETNPRAELLATRPRSIEMLLFEIDADE